jgi:HSP20 family protein
MPPTHLPYLEEIKTWQFATSFPGQNQELAPARDSYDPFLTLHREMNRLFDDVFRGFGSNSLAQQMEGQFSWPEIELDDGDAQLTVTAELPGMTEKDIQVEISNGVLTIRGEKKAERSG